MSQKSSVCLGSSLCFVLLSLVAVLVFPVLGFPQGGVQNTPVRETNETSGAKLFHSHCAACHGADGKGNGPAAAFLKDHPRDLTTLAKKNGGKFPSDHVEAVLGNSSEYHVHGSKDMPIWGPIFSQMGQERNMGALRVHNITEYLKSIQEK